MILFWSGKDKDFVTGRNEVASSVEQVTEGARANDDDLRVRGTPEGCPQSSKQNVCECGLDTESDRP